MIEYLGLSNKFMKLLTKKMHLELKNRIPNLRIESKRDFKKAEEGDSNWVWCGNHGRHGAGQMKGVEVAI